MVGQVRQPVLCPNDHVFCSTCMDVWLQRNQQCPYCRTPINPSNPVKQIKGGLNDMEDINDNRSNSGLRKARFDLLYQEFENEFSRMEAEITVLRSENSVMKDQTRKMKRPELAYEKPGMVESDGLLALTKKLQDAQKLYQLLKLEMTKLKEENNNLKDENVDLRRENEKLRLGIATRSPHRYGRYTVATLETKVENYEKEIRQLNKALERSDKYIEDLEHKVKGVKNMSKELASEPSSEVKKSYREVNFTSSSDNPAKRQLFGSSMEDLRNLNASSRKDFKSVELQPGAHEDDVDTNSTFNNTTWIPSSAVSPTKEKSPKKVHFSLPNDSNQSSSFDLDRPSPFDFSKSARNGKTSPTEFRSVFLDSSSSSLPQNLKEQKSILKTNDGSLETSDMPSTKRTKQGDTCDLDDTQTIRSELDDLNISLTPELSDCMKLLNRAEKKRHINEEDRFSLNSNRTSVEENPLNSFVPTDSYISGAVPAAATATATATAAAPATAAFLSTTSTYTVPSSSRSSPHSASALSTHQLPGSAYISTFSSQGVFAYKASSLDSLDCLTGKCDREKKGNFSYVSNTSNDQSSKGSDSYLPEPKKRLFESSDDLDLTLSPIKSTRMK